MDEIISNICEKIVELVHPEKIILFNQKQGLNGRISAFKLCVIADGNRPGVVEGMIYLAVDCDIPYDVLVYPPAEWEMLSAAADSFAGRINRNGSVLYVKTR